MGKELDPQQMELYRATDEVLHYIWDPIGVSGAPNARDEYWSYLPQVFQMLIDQTPKEKVVDCLRKIETERMGLNGNRERAERVVEILYEYKEKIFQPAL